MPLFSVIIGDLIRAFLASFVGLLISTAGGSMGGGSGGSIVAGAGAFVTVVVLGGGGVIGGSITGGGTLMADATGAGAATRSLSVDGFGGFSLPPKIE
jgi:hypothetical protein